MATRIREKAEARKANKDNRPYAKVKYVRMSPSKVRIVLDLVRGKTQKQLLLFWKILLNPQQLNAQNSLNLQLLMLKTIKE